MTAGLIRAGAMPASRRGKRQRCQCRGMSRVSGCDNRWPMRRGLLVIALISLVLACCSNRRQLADSKHNEEALPPALTEPPAAAPAAETGDTLARQNALWDELSARKACPLATDPTLKSLVSQEALGALEDLGSSKALQATVEQYAHIRPLLLRKTNSCVEATVTAGMHVFRIYRMSVEKGRSFLKKLRSDSSYMTRFEGMEATRESLATIMMGFVGSVLGSDATTEATRDEAFALMQEERSFRAMNNSGRALWIASVEQGFLVNPQVAEYYEQLRESVELARKVSADQQDDGIQLEIHRLTAGDAIGDGWYRVTSTEGSFGVELPFQARDQTRGPAIWPTHEITATVLNPIPSQGPSRGTFSVQCMRPTQVLSPEQMRANFEKIAASAPGSMVRDDPYENHPGVRLTMPGKADMRAIQFPERTCILGVEIISTEFRSETVDRFLGSFGMLVDGTGPEAPTEAARQSLGLSASTVTWAGRDQ